MNDKLERLREENMALRGRVAHWERQHEVDMEFNRGFKASGDEARARLVKAQDFAEALCNQGITGEADGFTLPRKWINPQIGLALKKSLGASE